MTTGRHDDFNAWLDAAPGGPSTPPSPASADPDLRDAQRAASQLHDLARHAERPPADPSLPPSWEEFMSTHNIAMSPPSPASNGPFFGNAPRSTAGAPGHHPKQPTRRIPFTWTTLANVTLAAVLVLTIGAGAWRATDGFGIGSWGGPNEPTSIPFGGFVQDDGTPENGAIDPASLPKAEDCTIEPLTVEQVLWYIQEPSAATVSLGPDATPLTGFPYSDPATPPATNVPAGPASQSDLDGMVETQRMWMACVLAESPFQVWATMSPDRVGRDLEMQLPPLTGVDEARQILESIQEETYSPENPYQSVGAPLGSTCGDMVVISSDPEDSYGYTRTAAVPEGTESKYGHYAVRFTFYDENGVPTTMGNTDASLEELYNYQRGFFFRWNDARQMWLIETYPNCG